MMRKQFTTTPDDPRLLACQLMKRAIEYSIWMMSNVEPPVPFFLHAQRVLLSAVEQAERAAGTTFNTASLRLNEMLGLSGWAGVGGGNERLP